MMILRKNVPRFQLNKKQLTVVLPEHQNLSRQAAKNFCQNLLKWLSNDWWIAKNLGFPYLGGWVVYNPKKGTVLETGLNKTYAKLICRELNGRNIR